MDSLEQNFDKEEISLKELFYIIKNNLLKLYISIILAIILAFLYIIVTRPIYSTYATILVEEEDSSMSSVFDLGFSSDLNYLDNEIQVLKSRTTAERAVTSLLNSEHINNLHLFNTREYKDGIFSSFVRKVLFLDWNSETRHVIGNEISDSLFNVFVEKLRDGTEISNLRNTDVLQVSYSTKDPYEAAFIINTIIDVYQQRDREWASGEMSYLISFLKDQLVVKELELSKVEQKLKEFQEKEHIYGLDDNSNLLLNQLTIVESDYYNTEAKKNILVQRKKYFENQLNQDEKKFTDRVSNTLDIQLYSIRQELSSLEAEFISTKSREGDSHPAVIELSRKIKNLKNVLNKESQKYIKQGISVANPIEYRQAVMDSVLNIDVFISGYNSKLSEMKNLILKYESDLSSLPEKYLKFSRFQRDRIILTETYSLMKQKLEEAKINEASQLGKIRVIDPAVVNLEPVSPNKKVILVLSLFLGLCIGGIIIFVTEFLDSTVKSIEEIERRGLAVLAIIPSIGNFDRKNKKKKGYKPNLKLTQSDKIERRLLTYEDPKSPISEAYRTLRTSLMVDNDEASSKVILVTSPGPGEGKTTTIANLAITYANMGKKTLLIDADLRKPVLHKMFKNDSKIKSQYGLAHYLAGTENNIEKLVCKTDIENFDYITSGIIPPNPSELLSSKMMEDFISNAKAKYDVILFDTPPLIAVTDAFVIAKYLDKFLLVVRPSVTQKGALSRSLVNMNNIDKNIDGVIFNGADESNSYGGGYYYNYYQYYANEDK